MPRDFKYGVIDRETAHEKSGTFLERTATPEGVARELVELHRIIVEQQILPEGEIAVRFSLLMGIAAGTIWRMGKP